MSKEFLRIDDHLDKTRASLAGFALLIATSEGVAYQRAGLRVLASAAIEADGRRWLHVSASRQDRIPSWEDLGAVKAVFVGDARVALQVFPPKDEYVNINPHVLHLWCCLDERLTPDFRHEVEFAPGLKGI